jgi:hypothetical protein
MKMKNLINLTFFMFLCVMIRGQSVAPELISSSGDFFANSSASLSFSIGECLTETFTGPAGVLTQGVHQPLEVVLSKKNEMQIFEISVSPVPAKTNIKIELQGGERNLTAILYDLSGKELSRKIITDNLTFLELQSFPAGNYILYIMDNTGTFIQSHKIIKHE